MIKSSSSRVYLVLSFPRGLKAQEGSASFRDWEHIVDDLSRAGWSLGCLSTVNSNGGTIFVAGAHSDDQKGFVASWCD